MQPFVWSMLNVLKLWIENQKRNIKIKINNKNYVTEQLCQINDTLLFITDIIDN